MFNRKGSILITAYIILFVLLILGGIFFGRTISDRRFFDITRERTEAFYLAEAGVDTALVGLANNYGSYAGTAGPVSLGRGEFEASVDTLSSTRKKILALGYVPSKAQKRAERRIEVITKKETPPDFYDYAIYSAGNIDLNGSSYVVNGKVIYADTIDNTGNITGDISFDPSISPLAHFDFAILRAISVAQGNLYDEDRLKDVQQSKDSYPPSFWFVPPTDLADPATGIPNVVYIEGDMVLNGNVGTIGGFFLVVGNVLTDPNDTSNSTINGNGQIDGSIYATGKFRINGGAGGLNVNGGVWAGTEAELNGNANVTFNEFFMDSIKALVDSNTAGSAVQVLSWRELE